MAAPSGQLATRLQTFAQSILNDFTTRQEAYRASRGRYWQGIKTPALTPLAGAPVAPDLTLRPTDQAESWAAAGVPLPAQVEASIRVDVYQGPGGWGYVICLTIRTAVAETWHRCFNVGPETWRTHTWQRG